MSRSRAKSNPKHHEPKSHGYQLRACRNERGAAMFEYAVLIVVVTLGVVTAIGGLSDVFNDTFNGSSAALESAAN